MSVGAIIGIIAIALIVIYFLIKWGLFTAIADLISSIFD
jgi:hypothetical protein